MNKTTPTLLFIALFGILTSCKQSPAPCFVVTTPADSIRVGHVVSFDASCSSDASSYYWDLGDGVTSTSAPVTSTTYDSATTYSVTLVVGSSGKSASIARNITVLP